MCDGAAFYRTRRLEEAFTRGSTMRKYLRILYLVDKLGDLKISMSV